MEKHEKDKITALSPELIELIDCNVSLIAHLRATNTIGLADEHHLMALTNKLERSKALLNILCTKTNGYKFLVEGLGKTSQSGALEILKKSIDVTLTENQTESLPLSYFSHLQIPSVSSKDLEISPFKKVPFQTKEAAELFTGRSSELETLLNSLLADGGIVSITGIGGIGKTELAKMFLQKLHGESYINIFKQIIWINCESTFTAHFDFTKIAKDYLKVTMIGSSGQQRDVSSIINDFYEKLKTSKSLIVLDNVETEEILQMYMPTATTLGKLSILVTSQTLKIGTNIPLSCLEQNDAADFVKKGLEIFGLVSNDFENGISELIVRLEMLPLAISQAIGYIKQKREMHTEYEPKDYIFDLYRIPECLLDKERQFYLPSNAKTIYKTLALALSKIEECKSSGLLATNILSKVAFIEEALLLIRRFSIIRFTPVNKKGVVYFNIHRLVQDVLRTRLSQNNETKNILSSTTELIKLNLNYELIDHALEIWKHVTNIQVLVKLFPYFPSKLTCEMNNNGRLADAFNFSTSALISLKQNLSIKEHAALIFDLQSFNNYLLGLQGHFDISLENLQKTLNEAKKYLPVGNRLIFKIRYYIARIFYLSGQKDKAALICDEMYKDYKLQKYTSLRILYNIGCLQNDLRKFQNAQTTARYILERLNSTSNKISELGITTKCLCAHTHGRMGNYRECINFYSEIIQTHFEDSTNKISSTDHRVILNCMGRFQYCAGLFDEAHDSYQKALNEINEQNKSQCSFTLEIKNKIAALMIAQNTLDEALSYSIEVYERMKQIFGEKSNITLESLGNIGMCYSKMGRHHDAVEILTQVIENEGYVFWSDDEAKLETYYFALSLEQIGRLERSIEILNELRLKCLETPSYKLVTFEQVDSALRRMHETKTRKSVLSTIYKITRIYL